MTATYRTMGYKVLWIHTAKQTHRETKLFGTFRNDLFMLTKVLSMVGTVASFIDS